MRHHITTIKSILRLYQIELEDKLERMLDADVKINLSIVIDERTKIEVDNTDRSD